MSDLEERLREAAMEAAQDAWRQTDGAASLVMGITLANEAADRIAALEAEVARARDRALVEAAKVLASDLPEHGAGDPQDGIDEALDHAARGYFDKIQALRSPSTTPAPSEAVRERAKAIFVDYFRRNYPGPDTIIYNPDWHAPKLFRRMLWAMQEAERALAAEGDRDGD